MRPIRLDRSDLPFNREVEVLGGEKPYLWIGDKNGVDFFGTLSGKGLRQLRDDITRALRTARKSS